MGSAQRQSILRGRSRRCFVDGSFVTSTIALVGACLPRRPDAARSPAPTAIRRDTRSIAVRSVAAAASRPGCYLRSPRPVRHLACSSAVGSSAGSSRHRSCADGSVATLELSEWGDSNTVVHPVRPILLHPESPIARVALEEHRRPGAEEPRFPRATVKERTGLMRDGSRDPNEAPVCAGGRYILKLFTPAHRPNLNPTPRHRRETLDPDSRLEGAVLPSSGRAKPQVRLSCALSRNRQDQSRKYDRAGADTSYRHEWIMDCGPTAR